MYRKFTKRFFDILLSGLGIIFLILPMAVFALIIRCEDRGPALFRQKRIGKNKTEFSLLKFRSMRMDTPHDVPTHMLADPEKYILRCGKWMRKFSIDELPQLFNIFIGQMSFVGPRPALWNQTDLIELREKVGANDIRPGLTGWAQVHGRDELEIPVKAMYDGEYAHRITFRMDLTCMLMTVGQVLTHSGVIEGGTGMMKEAYATRKAEVADDKTRKKKILFLSNHFITLYSFRRELIARLVSAGHEVWLSLPEDPDNKWFEDLGCHIIVTPISRKGMNPFKDMKLIRFYRSMMKKLSPDIIFSYTVKPNIYGSFASDGKYRQVCNITGLGGTFFYGGPVSRIVKLLYRMSMKKTYKVFFQNTGDRDFFIKNKLIGNNYAMLPGSGCNVDEYTFSPMPSGNAVRFIFVGRVMGLKGINQYLEAAEKVKAEYPDAEFIIAGWNEEEEFRSLVAEYEKRGAVKYIGFRKDIREQFRGVHCTVLPSLGGEGVPNVLLESAATGRCCIGSRISGTTDVIDDGVTGFLFEPGDADDLADKCMKIIRMTPEERAEMGRAGRERVVREFNRSIVIEKYEEEVAKA